MLQVIELGKRPTSAVDADEDQMITLARESAEVVLPRTRQALDLLGLSGLTMNPIYNDKVPDGLPMGFFPHPQHLLAAMKQKFSPAAYSGLCKTLLGEYGDTVSSYLESRLNDAGVKHDPANLKGWAGRVVEQPEGAINVYQLGAALVRFRTGDGAVYNLPARDGRKPLVNAGMIPAGLYEQALMFHFFPDMKGQIVEVDPYIVHSGDRVRDGGGTWADVSRCWELVGRADCDGSWDVRVNSYDSLLALL